MGGWTCQDNETQEWDGTIKAKKLKGNLSEGTEASDHGTAATDMVVNVCYGTSATPPTASTTTEGTIYVKYLV